MIFSGLLSDEEKSFTIIYIVYHIGMFIFTFKNAVSASSIKELGLTIPKSALVFAAMTGIIFSVVSIYLLSIHVPLNPGLPLHDFIVLHKWKFSSAIFIFLLAIVLYKWIKMIGLKEFRTQAVSAVLQNAECQEIFGNIQSVLFNDKLSSELEENIFAFDVAGDAESGVLLVELSTIEANEETIISGVAYLDNGKEISLVKQRLNA
jgi:hypothetical protein